MKRILEFYSFVIFTIQLLHKITEGLTLTAVMETQLRPLLKKESDKTGCPGLSPVRFRAVLEAPQILCKALKQEGIFLCSDWIELEFKQGILSCFYLRENKSSSWCLRTSVKSTPLPWAVLWSTSSKHVVRRWSNSRYHCVTQKISWGEIIIRVLQSRVYLRQDGMDTDMLTTC